MTCWPSTACQALQAGEQAAQLRPAFLAAPVAEATFRIDIADNFVRSSRCWAPDREENPWDSAELASSRTPASGPRRIQGRSWAMTHHQAHRVGVISGDSRAERRSSVPCPKRARLDASVPSAHLTTSSRALAGVQASSDESLCQRSRRADHEPASDRKRRRPGSHRTDVQQGDG
jgi:hypothetical protein